MRCHGKGQGLVVSVASMRSWTCGVALGSRDMACGPVSSPLNGDSAAQRLSHPFSWQQFSASLWCLQSTSSKISGFQMECQGTLVFHGGIWESSLGLRWWHRVGLRVPPLQPKQLILDLFYKVGSVASSPSGGHLAPSNQKHKGYLELYISHVPGGRGVDGCWDSSTASFRGRRTPGSAICTVLAFVLLLVASCHEGDHCFL